MHPKCVFLKVLHKVINLWESNLRERKVPSAVNPGFQRFFPPLYSVIRSEHCSVSQNNLLEWYYKHLMCFGKQLTDAAAVY